jgi:glutaredoxin 3
VRRVEVFTAGYPCCDQAVELVQRLACPGCEVQVLDTKDDSVAERASAYGVVRVPAIVVDGLLAECCAGRGPVEATLRAAGLGTPQI